MRFNLRRRDANVVTSIKPIACPRLSRAAPEDQERSFLPIAQLGIIVEVYNL
ncbi:hypothetical protein [Microcoleus vaginatus]|uniref:hypothetical protein n=1 Tax=Microcoleus vaginatus TaxID=119532 RepID=UPI001F61C2E2